VIELYNLGEAMTFPYIGLTFEDPTPPDGSRNNTQVTINVSCEDGNVTLWWNGTNYNETKPIDQESKPSRLDYDGSSRRNLSILGFLRCRRIK